MPGWPDVDVVTPVGRVLNGRYQLDELLGSGGMASVWRGRDLRLDRPVAVKELAGEWLDDPVALRRFDREARTAAGLAHPNIVAVHDVGVHGNSRYLVMELVDGATVAQLLTGGPLPVAAVIAIAAQTCDGLAAAHAAGVIHRDVKPANLMLTPTGFVKICDFGIARALHGRMDPGLTGPMAAMGTSTYMAPEQAFGDHLDGRADLYSLGATMYTMLAGVPPFRGNRAEVLHQHLSQPPAPLREHRADIPPALEGLVARMLAKAPAARPSDAAEVRSELAPMIDDPTAAVVPMPAHGLVAVRSAGVPHHIRSAASAWAAVGDAAPVDGRSPAGHLRRLIVAAAVAVVLVVTLISWLVTSRPVPGTGTDAAATLSAASPTVVTAPPQTHGVAQAPPSSRPTASHRSLAPSSQPALDPIAAMRLSIQRQVNTGTLNPDKATDLYNRVDAIAKAIDQGNTADVTKNIKAMRDKLAALRGAGQLTAGGYDELIADLDAIAASVN